MTDNKTPSPSPHVMGADYSKPTSNYNSGGNLIPAGWQWQMKHPASENWSDWRDGRARFGPEVGFQWREREVFAVVFSDINPEARFIEDAENSCPHCGGSGHKDDVKTSIETSPAALKKVRDSLRPLADAVYNDNGDMTVSIPVITSEECIAAYFARKRLDTDMPANPSPQTREVGSDG